MEAIIYIAVGCLLAAVSLSFLPYILAFVVGALGVVLYSMAYCLDGFINIFTRRKF